MEKSSPKISLLPGSIVAHRVRCGRKNCKCGKGERHGPYHYRYYWQDGKRRKSYIRRSDLAAVRAACAAYRHQEKQRRLERQRALAQLRRMLGPLRHLASWVEDNGLTEELLRNENEQEGI